MIKPTTKVRVNDKLWDSTCPDPTEWIGKVAPFTGAWIETNIEEEFDIVEERRWP